MKKIRLTQGKFAIVDDEDFKWLNQWRWYYRFVGKTGYAANLKMYMHRLILKFPKNLEADHINGNTLDNRKINLRIVTKSQNAMNRRIKIHGIYSNYKGVTSNKRCNHWMVFIRSKSAGHFNTEHHAALVYDLWADYLFGEYAKLNFQKFDIH